MVHSLSHDSPLCGDAESELRHLSKFGVHFRPHTLDTDFCIDAPEEALKRFGAPKILIRPRAQLTSETFTGMLKACEVAISMDAKGRWVDNVFVERPWRSVKYEAVYLRADQTPAPLRAGLNRCFKLCNTRRPHTALDRRTSDAVCFKQITPEMAASKPERILLKAVSRIRDPFLSNPECDMTKGIEDRSDQMASPFRQAQFLLLGLMALLCAPITVSAEAPYSDTYKDYLTPAKAQTIALRNNPSLAEMQARYEALAQIPSQTGALPDPVVSLNAQNLPTDSFDLEQEAMTQMQVGVSQKFPFPGKLSLREEAAEYEAQAAKYSVNEMRLNLSSNVSTKWWQIYYLDRALDTVESNLNLLRQFVHVAQKKYEVGDGLQQDVLLAQLELSKLLDKKIQISALRRNQAIQLNLLMSRPGNMEVVLPDKVPDTMPEIADEEALYARARASSPLLMEKRQKHEAAQSRLNLARRDHYPDFTVGVVYGNRRGDNPPPSNDSRSDFLSVRVGIEIPLYASRKQSKAVEQRSRELAQRRYAVLDTRNAIQGDISTAVTDYQRARERYSLFETGIVPQARQTVQSMMAGYKVSQVDFLNLVRSQITLFNNELEYWKALTQAQQALVRLQAAVGGKSIYE